jgi:hypothetical protein
MIRSTRSSDPAAFASPPAHIATHEQAPSLYGTTIVPKWSPEIATAASLKAYHNNLAMPNQDTTEDRRWRRHRRWAHEDHSLTLADA